MKKLNGKQSLLLFLLLVFIPLLGIFGSIYWMNIEDKKNNNTRDYKYENYCDSIYEVNPDYYIDVLEETEEYQKYIEEHGEWWNE